MNVSLPMLLFILFLTLKLCNLITWSWWFITLPIWGMFLFVFFYTLINLTIRELRKWR